MEAMILTICYTLWLLSTATIYSLAFKTTNKILRIFYLIYFIYSLGYLFPSYAYLQFGNIIDVHFKYYHYLMIAFLNLLLISIFYVDSKMHAIALKTNENIAAEMTLFLIGIVALSTDLRHYGWYDFLFTDKAARYASLEYQPNNLYFLSINYYLVIFVSAFSIYTKSISKNVKFIALLTIIILSIVSLVQGTRYYAAMLCILGAMHYFDNKRLTAIKTMFLIPFALFIAEFSKIFGTYIFFYEWVGEQGLYNYVVNHYNINKLNIVPAEILSISANTYFGLSSLSSFNPDFLGYFLKIIPFSEKFYTFKSFDSFYSTLIDLFGVKVSEGQGLAFSFVLENYSANFIPLVFTFILILSYRYYQSPYYYVLLIYCSLNIVRNGFLVAISEFKVTLLLFLLVNFMLYLLSLKERPEGEGSIG